MRSISIWHQFCVNNENGTSNGRQIVIHLLCQKVFIWDAYQFNISCVRMMKIVPQVDIKLSSNCCHYIFLQIVSDFKMASITYQNQVKKVDILGHQIDVTLVSILLSNFNVNLISIMRIIDIKLKSIWFGGHTHFAANKWSTLQPRRKGQQNHFAANQWSALRP